MPNAPLKPEGARPTPGLDPATPGACLEVDPILEGPPNHRFSARPPGRATEPVVPSGIWPDLSGGARRAFGVGERTLERLYPSATSHAPSSAR
jgi:hypothetical protein